MNRYFSADYIFSAHAGIIPGGILVTDAEGRVIDLLDPSTASSLPAETERTGGLLCPGFINAHCHLELSHLRGQIQPHTGFVGFAKELIPKRNTFTPQQIREAAIAAEDEMFRNGIVAVGDISNTTDSLFLKTSGRLRYHTFLELLAFDPSMAEKAMAAGAGLVQQFAGQSHALVPHAPYSVSQPLHRLIAERAAQEKKTITIHNQESAAENEFFEKGTGRVNELYAFLGMDISYHRPSGETAIRNYLSLYPPQAPFVLVHNTFSGAEDIAWAQSVHPNLYWCFCPKANLYIENHLPDYEAFAAAGVRITVGTDSLASNDTLSVLEELKVIAAAAPGIPTETLLGWATKNGAEALQFEDLGTFEKGKKPGILALKNLGEGLRMRAAAEVVRVL